MIELLLFIAPFALTIGIGGLGALAEASGNNEHWIWISAIIFIVSLIVCWGLLYIVAKNKPMQPIEYRNKIMNIFEVENDINELVYEIVYVEISTGKKSKLIVVEGHFMYNSIKEGKIKKGDLFND